MNTGQTQTNQTTIAEYIWLDGTEQTALIRSKTRIIRNHTGMESTKFGQPFPNWGFDGSSTNQADGEDSDCILIPVAHHPHPYYQSGYVVLCEVFESDGITPHQSNTRARLRGAESQFKEHECWFGFEQEYTFMKNGRPLGWPKNGFPVPQGPFYCGVGANAAFGRELVDNHMKVASAMGLAMEGTNAEVMPGQWEFQIGAGNGLTMSDDLIFGRWLLFRMGEEYGIEATLHPKPVKGDWNGAGNHTNFSTVQMRSKGGMKYINQAIERLSERHHEMVEHYGADNHERLTGNHETCGIDEFRAGVADRGASIRIPRHVDTNGYGYLEDRRPAANCDPYIVASMLMETICGE